MKTQLHRKSKSILDNLGLKKRSLQNLVLLLIISYFTGGLHAQGDSDFIIAPVNNVPGGNQLLPEIAMYDDGDFVVVWEDGQFDNDARVISARGFEADGTPKFSQVVVINNSTGPHADPDVAVLDNGNFVVVYYEDDDANGFGQIIARIYDENGSSPGDFITVNTIAGGQQRRPAVAANGNQFMVVWEDDNDGNDSYQILGAIFNAAGSQLGDDFTVNDIASGQQFWPDVAPAQNGGYITVWQDDNDNNGSFDIRARVFDGSGDPSGSGFTVNDEVGGQQRLPKIESDNNGSYNIVWEDDSDNNDFFDILAVGYNASNLKIIDDFRVNSIASGQQNNPSVAKDNVSGRFAVTWRDDSNSNGLGEIYAAWFEPGGDRLFDQDEIVNAESSGEQAKPAIAGSSINWVVVWEDDNDDNGSFQLIARGFDADNGPLSNNDDSTTDDKTKNLSIYPNPNTGKFQLDLGKSEFSPNAIVTVFDITGKIIFNELAGNLQPTIDLSPLPQGMYLLKVTEDDKFGSARISISK